MRVRLVDPNGNVLLSSIPPISATCTVDKRLIDLHSIANGIFQAEGALHSNFDLARISFECYGSYPPQLSEQISRLMEFIFGKAVGVNFEPNPQTFLIDPVPQEFANGYACLFSAGLDSYVGLSDARKRFENVKAVFTKHSDQGALSNLAEVLTGKLGNANLEEIEAPEHQGYTRLTRGVLYVLNSLLLRQCNVMISEVGPTMYQPRFTLLDSITITTHPTILTLSKKIAEEVLRIKLTFIKPFENMTKAELASFGSSDDAIAATCSCRNTAFAASPISNCGVCYACVVRNFAFLVAGIKKNVYRYGWNSELQIDNVVHLIRFSLDYLSDFDSMSWYTVDPIRKSHKEDLFRRFSLDNLAGLYLMQKEGGRLVPALERLMTLALGHFHREELEERVVAVREKITRPDYDNLV